MPSYLWPMISPPPVSAGYRLVMFGPYACLTFMYIQNLLAAHAFAMVWRLVCTFCRPSSVSYGVNHFLASHSLKPTPFGVGFLLGCGIFLFWATFLLFSIVFAFLVVSLCYSYCGVIWPKPAGHLWACCLFFPQWLSMVIWAFWLRCLWAPMSHYPFRHPWPIYFPWVFFILFLTLHSHRVLLTPLGFPDPITLSLILGAHGFAINPLLSLLTLLRACYGPFLLFYITYYLWVCHFSLSGLL